VPDERASASGSGHDGAAIRFAFVQGIFLSFSRGMADARRRGSGAVPDTPCAHPECGVFSRLVRRQHPFRPGSIAIGSDGASGPPAGAFDGFGAGPGVVFRCSIPVVLA